MSGEDLLRDALAVLQARLPTDWSTELIESPGDGPDLIIKPPSSAGQLMMMVEARERFSARDLQLLLGGPAKRWRKQLPYGLMVIAAYLSEPVREYLEEESVSYLDLTGNVLIKATHPAMFVRLEGARSDPSATKGRPSLAGAKAGAVIRALIDSCPPFTGAELSAKTRVDEGYVSRILARLADEGTVERDRLGPVQHVDWARLLRRRAGAVDLFPPGRTYRYVARRGPASLLADLKASVSSWSVDDRSGPVPIVTASFAAARIAPVAAPSVVVIYTLSPRELAQRLPLLETDAGADVVVIRPQNNVPFWRSEFTDGLQWATPSQVAIDCLSGAGRMPAEGEALVSWMQGNESEWRAVSLAALPDRQP